jgi:hypothetical protein
VVNLLNLMNFFQKAKKEEEKIQTEILLGLSLINARRFLQSAEIFQNISRHYLKKSLKKNNFSIAQFRDVRHSYNCD